MKTDQGNQRTLFETDRAVSRDSGPVTCLPARKSDAVAGRVPGSHKEPLTRERSDVQGAVTCRDSASVGMPQRSLNGGSSHRSILKRHGAVSPAISKRQVEGTVSATGAREDSWKTLKRLPDAGGDDHRSMESVKETVPARNLLLRPEKLHFLSARACAESSGAQGHVLHRGRLGRRGRHLASGAGRLRI